MGFDIECIIDLQSYPGEYFCPVCRTLVYPNEALQAQCTHVYCKPCLAHIANGTRACPYDGYLVTESDSKQLVESDKSLAEKIGKVKVHCLFFRSGCTWEGILSDSASHGSVCSFGNSPVICNRCGIQIVHRQVHEHAQVCPGVYDGQLAAVGASGLTRSGTTSSTVPVAVNQTVSQTGAPVQAQNPQNVAATSLPAQPNVQNSQSHNPPIAPVAPDQWYQQHYQQYYQQYVGFDPYQQHQQYYSLQQQPVQQYQHQVQAQGQQQAQVYSQTVVQPQAQPQQHPQPQPLQQPHLVHQAPLQPPQMQAQGQAQTQSHSQPQMPPQSQPPQGQAQSLASNYQVNPQQPLHPAMRPQTQTPQQALPPPPPPSQSSQPSQHPQATGVQPPAQHQQMPQYQQSQGPMHHSQASQAHMQPQMHPQTQAYTQSSNQLNVQTQPQSQPYQSHSQPPNIHPQANQLASSGNLPQAQHPPVTPVSGHQSYPQAQHPQANPPGALQQHLVHPNQASVSHHPVQVHGQVPQQPALMRPSHSHGSVPQQPSTLLPPQSMVHGAPFATNQQFLPYGQQPTYPVQPHPPMQPVQQHSNFAQQQQSHAAFQGQMHQQGHLTPLQSMQSQMHMNYGPPQLQQSQNYVGTPMMPNQGTLSQSHPFSSGGFGPLAPSGPAQGASTQTTVNQNHGKPIILEQNATTQDTRSPSKRSSENNFEGESSKENVRAGQNETTLKDANNAANDGLVKSVINQEKGDMMGTTEQSFRGKSSEAGFAEDQFRKEETHSLTESVSSKQGNLDNHMNLSKTAVAGQSSANYDRQSFSAAPPSSTEGHMLPPKSHGSHSNRSPAQVEGKPASAVGPQGPVGVPHHGQSHKLTDGKSQYGTYSARVDSKIAIAPPYVEGSYGQTNEVSMPRDRMLGSGEGGTIVKSHADEPSFLRTNGGSAPDSSMFGPRDENMKPLSKEHINFFQREPTRPLEQGSRSLDKPFHGSMYDAGSKLDPGNLGSRSGFLPHHPSGGHSHQDVLRSGPEFGQHHIKPFAYQSPGGDYLSSSPRRFGGPSSFTHGSSSLDDYNSREPRRFGEGPMSSNPSSDPVGNSFRDGRFPPLQGGHPRRGEIDGPMNPRFGEHMPPAQTHNQTGSVDAFWVDGPGHLSRGKPSGPGYLPGHFNMGETAGPGTFSGHGYAGEVAGNFPRPPFSEHVGGDRPGFPPFGDPSLRNNHPFHGFPNGGMDSIDQSRHRKPPSTGWCRICEVDCETVEGLEIHSQTREHQNMAMDVVKRFKFKGRKKHRPAGRMSHERGRSKKMGSGGRGRRH